MAYIINRYNNTELTTVQDGTINQTTDLRFVGKNYAGYGEIQNENFLYLLENFSGANPPPRAISGQVWFDSSVLKLKFYDGTKWRNTGGTEVNVDEPVGLTIGDLWWDSDNEQLYAYNGTAWVLIGPQRAGDGETRMLSLAVSDSSNNTQNIIASTINDEVVTVISQSEFTLNSVQPNTVPTSLTTGFDRIKRGVTLINTKISSNGITTPAQHWFWGTASNADKLGGKTADSYITTDNLQFNDIVGFTDSGITIGNDLDLKIYIENNADGVIENQTGTNSVIKFKNTNGSGVATTSFKITSNGIEPGNDNGENATYDSGTSTNSWRTIYANNFNGEATRATTLKYGTGLYAQGSIAIANNTVAVRDASGSLTANVFQGIATTTRYADLAEKYTTSEDFPVGTVMAVCTHEDHETCAASASDMAIGVISENPAVMMNSELENGQYIGLKGRVPVRITGPVRKGQAVYAWQDGVASTIATTGLVGIALESNSDAGEKLVECVLKV